MAKINFYLLFNGNCEEAFNFYKSAFVALVLDWIKNDLKDDPKMIISRLSVLIEGTILNALKNFSK